MGPEQGSGGLVEYKAQVSALYLQLFCGLGPVIPMLGLSFPTYTAIRGGWSR